MRLDPDLDSYEKNWRDYYQKHNYDEGIASWFMKRSHLWSEKKFSNDDYFPTVLEVGAGTGKHLEYVRHRFDEYILSDLNDAILKDNLSRADIAEGVGVKREDATQLSFEDNSVDRLIAAHVLEHLPNPYLVLREWHRVIKPNGIMTLILPCDPGMAWRFGRNFGPRSSAEAAGIEYNYWMAREHINAITNLIAFIRYYFDMREEIWKPLFVPSVDINLFYICHLGIKK